MICIALEYRFSTSRHWISLHSVDGLTIRIYLNEIDHACTYYIHYLTTYPTNPPLTPSFKPPHRPHRPPPQNQPSRSLANNSSTTFTFSPNPCLLSVRDPTLISVWIRATPCPCSSPCACPIIRITSSHEPSGVGISAFCPSWGGGGGVWGTYRPGSRQSASSSLVRFFGGGAGRRRCGRIQRGWVCLSGVGGS